MMVLGGRTNLPRRISAGLADQQACLPVTRSDSEQDGRTGSCRETREIHGRRKKQTSYYVYLLLCDDGSYYTGYTKNVTSRLQRHKRGRGARYTKMRKPRKIVHVEEFRTRGGAMRRERQIKALTHSEKRDLVGEARIAKSKRTKVYYHSEGPFRVT